MAHEICDDRNGPARNLMYIALELVLLEIVTGRKSVDNSQENTEPQKSLVGRVWDLYGRQQLMSAMDEKLCENFNREQAECLVVVGLWCGHPDRTSRPSIREAAI
ncbi:hypothetical protein ARALYDRAFT_357643 [Arabidopsis lyrata subsp. lyrata]|uniref:Serine-threonine/tyrosine-protein kinase catalytic domain-containing protein n=1 Tax=Arabidopsis lyrata subsp. lyrata TaxID=81972 RepID=D7MTL7_ARALL|nr:hypothetical protein ARALYDRAFT_357643 [Arabidopsis lyrata subsp. lyrata]